jgi:hypothetical protein
VGEYKTRIRQLKQHVQGLERQQQRLDYQLHRQAALAAEMKAHD